MARATAFEKVRIARQLRARPAVAEAFADGRLSYSAVRAMTRIEDPDADVDAALVAVAVAGTVADVERAVRCYQLHADQNRAPDDAWARRGLRVVRGIDGTGRIEITVGDVEIEEFAVVIQAFVDLLDRAPGESSAGDSVAGDSGAGPLAESAEESAAGDLPVADRQTEPARRADAFMDLVRVAVAHADDGHAVGADRYLVHVVAGPEGMAFPDGTPLDEASAGRVGCDASSVTHLVGGGGEPLALGRKTRVWSTAQRRAAMVRDGGHCRFPGCGRRIADLHHRVPWSEGGPTDLDNGFLACPRHHRLLHRGYEATGNPNGRLSFQRPDGRALGFTTPRLR